MIFTGPIDEYFDFRFGKLPYRSLRFEHVTLDRPWHQPVAVVNYPQTQDYTRVTEYKHLTGQEHPKTALTYEYPSAEGDPYYPIPKPENQELFKQYERSRWRRRTCGSSAGSRPTATTTWTRSSARRSPPSGASTRRCRRGADADGGPGQARIGSPCVMSHEDGGSCGQTSMVSRD